MKYYQADGDCWQECFFDCIKEWATGEPDLCNYLTSIQDGSYQLSMDGLTFYGDAKDDIIVYWTYLQ